MTILKGTLILIKLNSKRQGLEMSKWLILRCKEGTEKHEMAASIDMSEIIVQVAIGVEIH
jgi:hypothetical protein